MPVYDPLDPEAIDAQVSPGLLGQLGRVGLSGVAAVGNFLDTPASMVRDVLSFQNPIDNLFNPFSSANRVGGREMLRKYGLVGEEDTYANWWGGFAAEVALDPLTWLGAGALLKGGQALGGGAKGLFRASVPLSGLRKGGEIGFDFATGQGAEAAASVLGDLASYATKPSKLAPLLDKLPGVFSNAAKVQPPAAAAPPPAAAQVAPVLQEVRPTNDPTGALAAHATGELPRVDTHGATPQNMGAMEILEREVGPNEVLPPGSKVRMDVSSGKSYVTAADPHQVKLAELLKLSFKELGEHRDKMAAIAKADMEVADDLYRRRVTDSRAQAAENAAKNSDYLYKLASEAYVKHPKYDWRKGSTQHLDEIAPSPNSMLQEAAKVVDDTPYLPATGMSKFLRNYINEEVDLLRQAQDVDITGKSLAELQKTAMEDFLAWMNGYENKKALYADVGDNLEVNRLWKAAKEAAAYLDSHDLPAPKTPAANVVMDAAKVAPAPAAPPATPLSAASPSATSGPTKAMFNDLANLQRGDAESAMLKVQHAMGGGVLNPVVEHAGDLIHRMSERPTFESAGYEYVREKVLRLLRALDRPELYQGFRSEFRQNILNNAKYLNKPLVEYADNIDKALLNYAAEHAKLPEYNDAHKLAKSIAVAIGEKRFEDAVKGLREMEKHLASPKSWKDYAHQGLVEEVASKPTATPVNPLVAAATPPTQPPKPAATSSPSVDNPTRIYKAPPKIKEREFVQTLTSEGLMQRQALRQHELMAALKELAKVGMTRGDDAAKKKAKKIADRAAKNLDIINTEIAARAKTPATPKELQDFVKAGQIKYLNVPEKNIQDVSKVLPDNPLPEQVSDWAKTSANILTAPGRALAGLFHAPFLGKFDEVEQGIAARRWDLIGQGNQKIRADLSGGISDDIAHYRDAFQENFGKDVAAQLPGHYQNLANAEAKIRAYGESVLRMVGETGSVKEAFLEHGLDPDKIPEQMLGRMNSLLTSLKDVNSKAFGTYREVGGAGAILHKLEGEELVGELTEIGYFPGFEHMPRFMADTVSHIWGMIGGGMTRPEGSLSRLEPLRAVPAKIVENIGRLVRTGKAGKLKEEDIITAVADKYGKKWLNKEVAKIDEETGEKILKWGEGDAGIRAHAKALVDWARSSNFDHYMTDNLEANARYLRGIHTATANILAIQEAAQNAAKYAPMVAALPKEQIPKGWRQLRGIATPEEAAQYVSIDKAFSEAGLNAERALKYFAKQLGDDSAEAIAKLKDHVVIPMELAKAIKGSQNIWRLRGYPQMLAQIVDIPTRWFKENVTLPFVSFATRNLGSGLYLIASSGNIESLADLKLYGEKLMEAFDSYRKQNIASEKQREWFVNGVLHEGMIFEGVETRELRSYGHVAPDHINLKEIWGEAGAQVEPSVLDNIPGLRQARQAHGTVLGVGGKANKLIEFLLRVPLYEYLKAKGWNAADASKEVARLQVDYSKHAFSPFENEVMTRLFPFYKWQRSIAPVVLGTLLRKPAGLMGLTVHGSRLASSDDPRTPEWLGDTLAIENPLGSTEEGGRSYVTGFGLPYEPTLAFFGGGLRGAGREALAQLNPLVKAPLEWSTGQSFFQTGPSGAGRPLDELNPPIGQTLANVARVTGRDPSVPVDLPDIVEFAAANSPASRYITTARQITDPRKHPLSLAANLTTGVRVTDVSPEAQDAILRHRASALTRQLGGRTFSQSYFPSGIDLSPAEQGLADQLMELKRLLDQRSRARREAAPTM